MRLKPNYREVSSEELISYLLRESGQEDGGAVNPVPILDTLGLTYLSLDFARDLPEAITAHGDRPRALMSFPERVIATDVGLYGPRARFSTLHEIAHYVLPEHVEAIVLCTDRDLGPLAEGVREREANAFAAELLFRGLRFAIEANGLPIRAQTVKELAQKYNASFEATARRLAERNLRPCMLVVFERPTGDERIDTSLPPRWVVKYCIPSRAFAIRYFSRAEGSLEGSSMDGLAMQGRDIADTVTAEQEIALTSGDTVVFRAEYFSNGFNIFCLLQPADKRGTHAAPD